MDDLPHVLVLPTGTFRVERAIRSDVPALVALLDDDALGAAREVDDPDAYDAAFDAVARDPAHLLVAVRDSRGRVVATLQPTLLPGLPRGGATRLHV